MCGAHTLAVGDRQPPKLLLKLFRRPSGNPGQFGNPWAILGIPWATSQRILEQLEQPSIAGLSQEKPFPLSLHEKLLGEVGRDFIRLAKQTRDWFISICQRGGGFSNAGLIWFVIRGFFQSPACLACLSLVNVCRQLWWQWGFNKPENFTLIDLFKSVGWILKQHVVQPKL